MNFFTKLITSCLIFGLLMSCSDSFIKILPSNNKLKNKLEQKVAYFFSNLNRIKNKKNVSISNLSAKNIQRFYKIVDVDQISVNVLGEYFDSFDSKEIKYFQNHFLLMILNSIDKKVLSSESKYSDIKMKFVNRSWEKETRVVAIEVNLDSESDNIEMILEFDKNKDVLLDFYFVGYSLVEQYKEQFEEIISSQGKKELLNLLESAKP